MTQRDVVHMALEETFLEGPDLMALACCSKGYNWASHACSNYVHCRQILRLKRDKLEEEQRKLKGASNAVST